MSVFKRLFRVSQAEAHAIVDKFEDPIKMTEQGIRDLKKDLQFAPGGRPTTIKNWPWITSVRP
jgi:phage shock protein A